MRCLSICVVLLCVFIGCCSTHNILVVLPTPFWSHYMQVEPIFLALAQRGHSVTAMSPFPPKKEIPNFKHVLFTLNTWAKSHAKWNLTEDVITRHEMFYLISSLKTDTRILSDTLSSAVFQDLIRSNNTFDLIFTELFMHQEAFVVLGHIFNAPVVTYNSYGHNSNILKFIGAANSFSYIPEKHLGYAGSMSLTQRLHNAFTQSVTMIYHEYWNFPSQDALISQHIPGAHPSVSDMLWNISLIFLTANTAVDGAKLYPPNVVEISGMHFKEPSPLDEELKTIMDNAKTGVIYFAFGSLVKMSEFRKEDIQTFLSVFKQLDRPVLWQTNLNVSDWEIPENVHTRAWFNQISIFAHPNCALFVTHGGLSSVMEAIRYAVPMVGMPIFADQYNNLANVEYHGYGLQVQYLDLTHTSFHWAITTVLANPRFKENVSRASRIFVDRSKSSLDKAVDSIEYVIRHEGAHHLKPLAAQIPWYQLFLLDIIGICFMVFIVVFYIVPKLVCVIFTRCAKSRRSKKRRTENC